MPEPREEILGRCPICSVKAKLDATKVMPWHTRRVGDAPPQKCPGIGREAVKVESAGRI